METTSPMEALAFRYAAGAAGSLWAWVAVVAAALSVWRFRVGATSVRTDSSLPPSPAVLPTTANTKIQPLLASPPPSGACLSTPKKRFTAYFSSDDDHMINSSGVEEEEVDVTWREWEVGIRRKRGDLGWYRYLDMAALDGSVVRLWDGGRRRRKV